MTAIAFFIGAFIFASFVEYWIHRLMHKSVKLGKRHRDHHKRNEGQGVVWEFFDYVKGSASRHGHSFFLFSRSGIGLGKRRFGFCPFLSLRSPTAARKSHQSILDEDARPLCPPQIQHVVREFWFSCGLVGSYFWNLQRSGMAHG